MAEAVELESFGRKASLLSFSRAVQDFVVLDMPGIKLYANIPARLRPEIERTVLVDVVLVEDEVFERLAQSVRVAATMPQLGLQAVVAGRHSDTVAVLRTQDNDRWMVVS